MVMVMQAAEAATEAAKTGGKGFLGLSPNVTMILMMVLMLVVVWLFMIRPQQKQQKELAKFRNALEKGQKVVTAGGIHGVIKEVKETSVVIAVDRDVTLEVEKGMITRAPGDTTPAQK
jgi:preprotein translocase subunit YajC